MTKVPLSNRVPEKSIFRHPYICSFSAFHTPRLNDAGDSVVSKADEITRLKDRSDHIGFGKFLSDTDRDKHISTLSIELARR